MPLSSASSESSTSQGAPAAPQQTNSPQPASEPTGVDGLAAVIVLAAGQGTRMKSRLPKVLHPLAGQPLVWHAMSAAAQLQPQRLVAVLGHGREAVSEFLSNAPNLPPVTVAIQDEQKGTGHAVSCAYATTGAMTGTVVVTYGDVPLLRSSTLAALVREHVAAGNAVTMLTAVLSEPTGYGRVLRDDAGHVVGIVEQKDATAEQRAITEINSGVYAFDAGVLADALGRLTDSNAAGEQYLTDVVAIAKADGRSVGSVQADDPIETEGVNDRVQLAVMARVLNARLVREHQVAGVTIHDPATTWIHADVTIGPDTEILPGTLLQAGTSIGSGCSIGPDTTLSACTVGDGATVERSVARGAEIGPDATVGPFSHLRPGTRMAANTKVGAFAEVKSSAIGVGSKVPHLSYIGDTTIGTAANVGAGTITANYDGANKFPTVIGNHSFVGSNTTLVAPVTVGDGAYVAAGSTITADLAPGDLGIARGRQRDVTGWVQSRKPGSRAAEAASAALSEHAAGPESAQRAALTQADAALDQARTGTAARHAFPNPSAEGSGPS